MIKMTLRAKQTNTIKHIEVEDVFQSLPIAKAMVKELVEKGIKNPRVEVFDDYTGLFGIITKKEIEEKLTEPANLTEKELEVLKILVKAYAEDGVENCDYYNVFGHMKPSKRGVVGSLIRKQVLDKTNNPECFNPLFPSNVFVQTCKKYNIEIDENTLKDYC